MSGFDWRGLWGSVANIRARRDAIIGLVESLDDHARDRLRPRVAALTDALDELETELEARGLR